MTPRKDGVLGICRTAAITLAAGGNIKAVLRITRSDFLNNVNNFNDLVEFIFYNDIEDDVFPDDQTIFSNDMFDEVIEKDIVEYCSYDFEWRNLNYILANINLRLVGRFEYIISNGVLSYKGATEQDFAILKVRAASVMDRDEKWDEEDEFISIGDDFNTDDLMSACHDKLVEIENNMEITFLTDQLDGVLFGYRSNNIIINDNICFEYKLKFPF